MSFSNCLIAIDKKRLFRLLFVLPLVFFALSVSRCATIETSQYPEGPYIVSTYPSSGDFNISRYSDIHVRFSEVMDPGTETGFEMLSKGVPIEGEKKLLNSNTVLIFRPYRPLEANGMYQCIMKEGKSKDGKALVGVPYIWTFTTGN